MVGFGVTTLRDIDIYSGVHFVDCFILSCGCGCRFFFVKPSTLIRSPKKLDSKPLLHWHLLVILYLKEKHSLVIRFCDLSRKGLK